jgi:hypothetical protein
VIAALEQLTRAGDRSHRHQRVVRPDVEKVLRQHADNRVPQVPSSVMVRPTTPASAPSCVRQKPSLTSTSPGAFGRSASLENPRPMAGRAPITVRNPAVTRRARMRWARSMPV